jgi:hypothetical protein
VVLVPLTRSLRFLTDQKCAIVVAQAQAKLWEALGGLGERLADSHAVLRELTVRRYRPPDLARIEAGGFEADEVPADEDPDFQQQYQHNRCCGVLSDRALYS